MPPKRANPIDYPPPASSSEVEDDTTSGSSVDEDASSSDEEQTPAPSPPPKTQTLTPKSAVVKPQSSTTKQPTTEDSGSSDSDSESEDDSKLGSGSEEEDDDSDSDEEEEEPLPVTTPPPKKATTSKDTKSSKEADETPTPVASKNVAENGEKPEDGKKLFQRIWSDTDEVAVLEGIIEYKALKGSDPVADINAFRDFIKSRLHFDVSLSQLRDKISRLKKKFKDQYQKDENKTYPGEQNQKLFDLSKVIWAAGAGASNGNVEKSNAKAEKSTEKAEKSPAKSAKSIEKAEKSPAKSAKSNGKAEKSKSESGRKKAEDVTTDEDEDEDVVMEESNGVMKMGTDMDRSAGSNKRMKFDFYDFSICGESMEDFVRKGLQFVDEEKRPAIEAKWKKLQVEELKLAVKKHALLKEQTELMVATMED